MQTLLVSVGIGLLSFLLLLGAMFLRRYLIARGGGTIELSVRLSTLIPGRGWAVGIARFVGDELRWYRLFSLWPRPKKVFSRRSITVELRRVPDARERLVLPGDCAIVRCVNQHGAIEIAMAVRTLTGFLSWVEAAPPGAISDPPHWSTAT